MTNHARVAIYVLNSADGSVIGKGATSGLLSTSGWQLIQCVDAIPAGVTAIKIRIAVRNVTSGETGCVVEVVCPYATFNIEAPSLRRIGEVIAHTDLVPGRLATEEVRFKRPISFDEQVVTDFVSTALPTAGRAIARVTGHASGNTVNGVTGLRDNAPCLIINDSGVDFTLSVTALATPNSVLVKAGEAVIVAQVDGEVWLIGPSSRFITEDSVSTLSNKTFNLSDSVTPANLNDMMIERTNNTTLTFRLKGTDGTVRSGTITLS